MHTIRVHKVVDKDGEILVRGVPCKKGQHVEVIMLIEPPSDSESSYPTARQLLESIKGEEKKLPAAGLEKQKQPSQGEQLRRKNW